MAESVEDFLARGGQIESVEPNVRKYRTIRELQREQKRKLSDEEYTEWSQKRAENQTEVRNAYYGD